MRLSATIEHPYGDEVSGNSRPATAVRYVVESSTRASQLIWRGENCAELRMRSTNVRAHLRCCRALSSAPKLTFTCPRRRRRRS